ncbi:hypothetical protein [Bifidobacterium magnum]|uniref:Uncharacterized protein n=1 Tax=Bifidobacterium magnum TaxID=1692 RepID=A0A087BEP8_9BIFI|nr:hypothetical protein [Bifidobacterium magnum]KFI69498.1 hypothetical protein BMAGN_1207 [Bifidobacterium magnum]
MVDEQKNLDNLSPAEVESLEQVVKETEPTKAEHADQVALDKDLEAKSHDGEEIKGAVDAMWGDEMRGN